ncbi:MAG: arginine decarboxylase, pyruvoyl-dependent [Deltaproteobacteria bacterium]|nr:arginine decarboxylase, pyruvoyl-dependent [Deltaproteobacteria bacterium]
MDAGASKKHRKKHGALPESPLGAPGTFVPKAMFFTNGVGVHRDRLTSFELSLRDAGVATANLVTVSSIFPPHCRIVPRKEGVKLIQPGQITFCVMARQDTNEPNRLIAASIGLARPADSSLYGYLSEHHSYGETGKKAGDYAEDLAATMLATTLGLDFDPAKAYDQRKEVYRMAGKVLHTKSITQSSEGHKDGMWTTVVALGVFVL